MEFLAWFVAKNNNTMRIQKSEDSAKKSYAVARKL